MGAMTLLVGHSRCRHEGSARRRATPAPARRACRVQPDLVPHRLCPGPRRGPTAPWRRGRGTVFLLPENRPRHQKVPVEGREWVRDLGPHRFRRRTIKPLFRQRSRGPTRGAGALRRRSTALEPNVARHCDNTARSRRHQAAPRSSSGRASRFVTENRARPDDRARRRHAARIGEAFCAVRRRRERRSHHRRWPRARGPGDDPPSLPVPGRAEAVVEDRAADAGASAASSAPQPAAVRSSQTNARSEPAPAGTSYVDRHGLTYAAAGAPAPRPPRRGRRKTQQFHAARTAEALRRTSKPAILPADAA